MASKEHTLSGKPVSSEPVSSHSPARPVKRRLRRPRILLVTPELGESSFLSRHGHHAPCAKAGGLADVSALLLDTLTQEGLDVHVAMPNFRGLFHADASMPSRQLHLCQDREFFYRRSVYDGSPEANLRAAMAFQRDVIHYILPRLRPDIVHCHDWMTGLVPAAARAAGIPSLFTVHNLHDERSTMSYIEEKGVDVPRFWQHLYFEQYPSCYEAMRDHATVSLLGSGILAADRMNTVSPSFLHELSVGGHGATRPVADAVRGKMQAGRADGILNSIPARVRPSEDRHIVARYDEKTHVQGKRANKLALQKMLGLEEDADAPMLFWPSRLDPMQKGCQLLAEILYKVVSDYWGLGLQVVFIADGPFQPHFRRISEFHGLQQRIAVHHFSEPVSRLGYAASDFTLMPSAYEPCGLSQMVALRYGSLPIVHGTGGLRDTVSRLDAAASSGNGFIFETHDANGLRWAIDEAVRFQILPAAERQRQITRVMTDALRAFSPDTMVAGYMDIYSKLLQLRA